MQRSRTPRTPRTSRTTALTAPVLALVSALALSACGGSGSSGDDSSDGGAKGKPKTSTAPSPKADPAAELNKVVLGKSEVKGFRVEKPQTEFVFAKSRDEIKVDKAGCAPLAYAMSQFPLATPRADLTRVASGAKGPGAFTYVALASYPAGKAKAALAELSRAVGSCGGGFTAKAGKNTNPYASITAEKAPTPAGADESVAFNAVTPYKGRNHTVRTLAARHGDTLAVYFAVDGTAFVQSYAGNAKVAQPIVKAQSAKLSG
ncbi:hypothetical protein [Streptomyces sp. NPDC005865]|uniref:hypothetical protein n=1 Tax=Streptomyces sp. NPDC005865 TaxID=3155453 RepID=UPI0033D565EB